MSRPSSPTAAAIASKIGKNLTLKVRSPSMASPRNSSPSAKYKNETLPRGFMVPDPASVGVRDSSHNADTCSIDSAEYMYSPRSAFSSTQSLNKIREPSSPFAGQPLTPGRKFSMPISPVSLNRQASLEAFDSNLSLVHEAGKSTTTNNNRETINVLVRCRPFIASDDQKGAKVFSIDEETNTICLEGAAVTAGAGPKSKQFTYDRVFGETSTQAELFEAVRPIIDCALHGLNGTIFAYGQTSSGKTHTMMGVTDDESLQGIIPNTVDYVFNQIATEAATDDKTKYLLLVSFLEIYNEHVHDLLGTNVTVSLDVRQNQDLSFFVPDLTKHAVASKSDLMNLISKADQNRKVAATACNAESSRSHSMMTLYIEKSYTLQGYGERMVAAKLNLVDLAGSERLQDAAQSQSASAARESAKETVSINQSLTCLANVISALTSDKPGTFVPYRDSKLTRLLKDSLGGNAKTVMIACINPSGLNSVYTTSTLRYASRAKRIKNKPKINEDPKDAMMRSLTEEIEKLRRLVSMKDTTQAQMLAVVQRLAQEDADSMVIYGDGDAKKTGVDDIHQRIEFLNKFIKSPSEVTLPRPDGERMTVTAEDSAPAGTTAAPKLQIKTTDDNSGAAEASPRGVSSTGSPLMSITVNSNQLVAETASPRTQQPAVSPSSTSVSKIPQYRSRSLSVSVGNAATAATAATTATAAPVSPKIGERSSSPAAEMPSIAKVSNWLQSLEKSKPDPSAASVVSPSHGELRRASCMAALPSAPVAVYSVTESEAESLEQQQAVLSKFQLEVGKIGTVAAQKQKVIESVKIADLQQQLVQLKAQSEGLRSEWEDKIKAQEKVERDELRAQLNAALDAAQQEATKAAATLRQKQALEARVTELEMQSLDYSARHTATARAAEQQLAQATESYQSRLTASKQEHAQQVHELRVQYEAQLQIKEQEVQKLNKKVEAANSHLSAQQQSHQDTVEKLRREIEDMSNALKALKQQFERDGTESQQTEQRIQELENIVTKQQAKELELTQAATVLRASAKQLQETVNTLQAENKEWIRKERLWNEKEREYLETRTRQDDKCVALEKKLADYEMSKLSPKTPLIPGSGSNPEKSSFCSIL